MHTKEPWHVGPYYKNDVHSPHQATDSLHVISIGSSMIPCDCANAARIVSCVNAMARITDPALHMKRSQIALASAAAQLEACVDLVCEAEGSHVNLNDAEHALSMVREVLAELGDEPR